jgi:hypothetical protein
VALKAFGTWEWQERAEEVAARVTQAIQHPLSIFCLRKLATSNIPRNVFVLHLDSISPGNEDALDLMIGLVIPAHSVVRQVYALNPHWNRGTVRL